MYIDTISSLCICDKASNTGSSYLTYTLNIMVWLSYVLQLRASDWGGRTEKPEATALLILEKERNIGKPEVRLRVIRVTE
jgi:hypothetical protein